MLFIGRSNYQLKHIDMMKTQDYKDNQIIFAYGYKAFLPRFLVTIKSGIAIATPSHPRISKNQGPGFLIFLERVRKFVCIYTHNFFSTIGGYNDIMA